MFQPLLCQKSFVFFFPNSFYILLVVAFCCLYRQFCFMKHRAFLLWICRPLFPAPLWLRSASGFKSQSMGQCFFLSLQYPGNSCGTGCVDCSPNPCVHRGVEGTWILWMYLLSLLSALFWNDRLFSIPSVYCVVTIMCLPANKVITFLIFNVKYFKLTVVCAESGSSSSKVG